MHQDSRARRLLRPPRVPLVAVLLACIAACDAQPSTGPAPRGAATLSSPVLEPGAPLPGLTLEQRALFERGRGLFQTEFTPETGLGPLFNNNACSQCHEDPVVGGIGEEVERHATAFRATAFRAPTCDDLGAHGGPVIQDSVTPALHAALGIDREPVPAAATDTAVRTTASLLGFGLLEAVPDAEILVRADPFDRNGDGISGRPNRTADGRIGRFGRKAQVATLRDFNRDAFVMEMGVTDPGNPTEQTVGGQPLPPGVDPVADPEISQDQFDAADAFVRFLAPPPREQLNLAGQMGAVTFARIGCASCHIPALLTGASPIPALRFKTVRAFTDLLLHDMGPDLADIVLGESLPSEFRTEPLMGLRFATAFLHDGRAATIEDAITLHSGEGLRARNRFLRLSAFERDALLRFLRSL